MENRCQYDAHLSVMMGVDEFRLLECSLEKLHYCDCYTFRQVPSFTKHKRPELVVLERHFPAAKAARTPPLFICDPDDYGFAKAFLDPTEISLDDHYCYKLSDARVMGYKTYVTRNGGVLEDERLEFPGKQARYFSQRADKSDPLLCKDTDIVRLESGGYGSTAITSPSERISEPTVSLCSDEPSNFGSWIFRVLPKLITARRLGLGDYKVFCYCPQPWQRELLNLVGIKEEKVICQNTKTVYHFDELYVPSLRNSQAYIHESSRAFFRQIAKQYGAGEPSLKRIYLSRRNHAQKRRQQNVRMFINEAELEERLEKVGFHIICPEELSIKEQVAVFHGADLIVTPSGSAMFNTVFAKPGTTILDIEAFPYWLWAHTNLFASLQHRYALFIGSADESDPSPVHKQWSLRVDEFMQCVGRLGPSS
jgi:hypothetical protein